MAYINIPIKRKKWLWIIQEHEGRLGVYMHSITTSERNSKNWQEKEI